MAILIKEIHVRTTIENRPEQIRADDPRWQWLKKEAVREIRASLQKQWKTKNER